jgi:hypothetical protein
MKIWLDDMRPMPEDFDVHAKTAEEAIHLLDTEWVELISLDHDLGPALQRPDPSEGPSDVHELTGYSVAKHIEAMAHMGALGRLEWRVHSANAVGRENIIMAMKSAERGWEMHERFETQKEKT